MAWTLLLCPAVALAPAQDRVGAPDRGAAELVRTLDEGTAKEREVALERLLEGDGAARVGGARDGTADVAGRAARVRAVRGAGRLA
ncbi:MAG: hypothetical protein R3F34_08680 [Planctomycetota bacterium]